MIRTYKYRLMGKQELFDKADNWLMLCRNLYNICLEQKIIIYRQDKTNISCYSQMKQLHELKEEFTDYQRVDGQVLQQVIQRLDKTYKEFFIRIKRKQKSGFPRYKNQYRYKSFTLKTQGWKLDGKYFTINKIGRFKLRLSRNILGNIKIIRIVRESSNKWYACFVCDIQGRNMLSKSSKSIGIDVGIKSFLADSVDNTIDNPQYFRKSEQLLRRRQRKLSRCKRDSNRRHNAKLLIAKAYDKIKNQRNDFLHKTANHYIKEYGFIAIEDLNIKGMTHNHSLAKSISDSSWGKFFELLNYKAEEAGRVVVKVPRFEPTSKTCSECGAINQDLKLSNRIWVCKSCGILHDRDFNAAKNILRAGQALQSITCADTQSVDCESLRENVKQHEHSL